MEAAVPEAEVAFSVVEPSVAFSWLSCSVYVVEMDPIEIENCAGNLSSQETLFTYSIVNVQTTRNKLLIIICSMLKDKKF